MAAHPPWRAHVRPARVVPGSTVCPRGARRRTRRAASLVPDHLAHQQVVGAVIAGLRSLPRHRACLFENDLVRVKQPRDLHGNFVAPRGGRGISVISATSWAMAMLTPPSD